MAPDPRRRLAPVAHGADRRRRRGRDGAGRRIGASRIRATPASAGADGARPRRGPSRGFTGLAGDRARRGRRYTQDGRRRRARAPGPDNVDVAERNATGSTDPGTQRHRDAAPARRARAVHGRPHRPWRLLERRSEGRGRVEREDDPASADPARHRRRAGRRPPADRRQRCIAASGEAVCRLAHRRAVPALPGRLAASPAAPLRPARRRRTGGGAAQRAARPRAGRALDRRHHGHRAGSHGPLAVPVGGAAAGPRPGPLAGTAPDRPGAPRGPARGRAAAEGEQEPVRPGDAERPVSARPGRLASPRGDRGQPARRSARRRASCSACATSRLARRSRTSFATRPSTTR